MHKHVMFTSNRVDLLERSVGYSIESWTDKLTQQAALHSPPANSPPLKSARAAVEDFRHVD